MMTNHQIGGRKILLVEGEGDRAIVRSILNYERNIPRVHIENCQGFNTLVSRISLDIKAPNITAVGILVDADGNLNDCWNQITEQLIRAGVSPPDNPCVSGTVIDGELKVGVWMMPDNSSSGEIEDFVAELIHKNDPVWPMAKQYIDGIPNDIRQFSEKKVGKARLYAWIATRKRPGLIGPAFNPDNLDFRRDSYLVFVEWLRDLFE